MSGHQRGLIYFPDQNHDSPSNPNHDSIMIHPAQQTAWDFSSDFSPPGPTHCPIHHPIQVIQVRPLLAVHAINGTLQLLLGVLGGLGDNWSDIGRNMDKTAWENHRTNGKKTWKKHRKTRKIWENHGKNKRKLEKYGKIMEKKQRKTIETWEDHEKTAFLEKWWPPGHWTRLKLDRFFFAHVGPVGWENWRFLWYSETTKVLGCRIATCSRKKNT